jgi:cell division septation protein DedD
MSRASGRRAPAGVAALCGLLALVLGGCNNANLTRRELVVHFDTSASAADHTAARTACASAAPHASPEPAPSPSTRGAQPANDVRFRVDHASDRDLNALLQCLRRQRGVAGFDLPEAGG